MSKRNTIHKERANGGVFPSLLVGVGVLVVGLAVLYSVSGAQYKVLQREVKELEVTHLRLQEELKKERVKWGNLKTPERLEIALYRHGTVMRYPTEHQIVRMMPVPGVSGQQWTSELPVYGRR